jgi:hypothetical protein
VRDLSNELVQTGALIHLRAGALQGLYAAAVGGWEGRERVGGLDGPKVGGRGGGGGLQLQ